MRAVRSARRLVNDGDATSIDNKSYNYVPEEDSKPIVERVNPGLNHEREDERVPFNRVPLYPPFGVPYWTAPNRSPGTVAPLMSDSADRSDESENRFREGVDYKIEYRYDDVSGTSCLRPVIGLLLAFSIFLIFFNR
uniref:Uncharacterized protein n=1 Tax=Plectus sambesii TaxID=2011161 RepID=A0A914WM00_9BILA